jgi:hypothetical protein
LLAACGDDGVRHTPDATPHDGPVSHDAAVDAPGIPVTLTATLNGQAAGGIHVYFQNADSSLVLATVTDASGNASAVMAAGGYVTAISPYTPPAVASNAELDTFVDVKPGDQLHLAMGTTSTSITVTVTAPADPAATLYSAFSPCGQAGLTSAGSGAAPSGSMYLTNCGATTDFLIVSYNASNVPIDFFFVSNVAVANAQAVDLTAHTWGAVPTRTYSYNNTGTLQLQYSDTLVDVTAPIYTATGYVAAPAIATGSSPMPAFTGANDLLVAQASETRDLQSFVDWGPYTAAFTTDLAPRLLSSLTSSPTFDPTTHTLSFTEDTTTGATPDFVFGSVSAARTADAHNWTWRIAAPHAMSIVYPHLPTDVYDYNITAADGPSSYQLVLGKVPGGYDAVRPYMLSVQGQPSPSQFALGASGSATIEQYAALFTGAQRKATPSRHPVLSHRRQ